MAKKRAQPPPVPPELLAAVLADPDDDPARQTLADALQERGDPRGEFIAVQLELARHEGEGETPETKQLWNRFRELHSAHSAKWARPLRVLGKKTRWELHRGFARQLRLASAPPPGLELVAAAFAVEPVTHLVLDQQLASWVCSLLAIEGIARLRRLCIFTVESTVGLAKTLATAEMPHLGELRVGLFGDTSVEAFAPCKLPALRHLALGCVGINARLTDAGLATLLRSPVGQQLHTLEIGRCPITPAMSELVISSQLESFSASVGWADECEPALRARFGDRFVIESGGGFDFLLDGVPGLSETLAGRG